MFSYYDEDILSLTCYRFYFNVFDRGIDLQRKVASALAVFIPGIHTGFTGPVRSSCCPGVGDNPLDSEDISGFAVFKQF